MRSFALALLAVALAFPVLAALPPNQLSPTIINNAPAFSGYPVADAIDGNANTDYASAGQGTNTFIDFDFGAQTYISQINWWDRVTSGGPNGSYSGGSGDAVTKVRFIFSTDSTFGNGDDTFVENTNPLPATCCQSLTFSPGRTARYVRFQVVATQGQNPGASEIQFFTARQPVQTEVVPTLSGLTMLLLGFALAGAALFAVRR